jgi:hypothetical protein
VQSRSGVEVRRIQNFLVKTSSKVDPDAVLQAGVVGVFAQAKAGLTRLL